MVSVDRRPIIIANWKMNQTLTDAVDLAQKIRIETDRFGERRTEVVLCPPFILLSSVAEVLNGTAISLGAQNCYPADNGAFTGEVSAAMLSPICKYVIVGHSERRTLFGEEDSFVHAKAAHALAHGLTPVVCVGESLETYEAGDSETFVTAQVAASLADLPVSEVGSLVIAYEPIWAIGTGYAATADTANRMIRAIRRTVKEKWGAPASERVRIQYGGSVGSANAMELLAQPEIDGALVGSASLDDNEFKAVVSAAEASLAQ